MILHAYGCSWTEGEGADRSIEDTIIDRGKKRTFRNSLSWVKFLSDKLNLQSVNNAISGNSNNRIFNQVIDDIKNEKIKSNDFVTIMWSSSLRDPVPFLPTGEWVSWSIKHLIETPERFVNSFTGENKNYVDFLSEYKKFFLLNIFNQNYYNIVNQNYIIFLQKLFEHYGIKYMMCDAIEKMLVDLKDDDDITNLINKKPYWSFNIMSFRDFLNRTNRLDIWEYQDANYNTRATQHPNKVGYQIIADELEHFIIKNKIL